jgi:hypothetical protein
MSTPIYDVCFSDSSIVTSELGSIMFIFYFCLHVVIFLQAFIANQCGGMSIVSLQVTISSRDSTYTRRSIRACSGMSRARYVCSVDSSCNLWENKVFMQNSCVGLCTLLV